MTASTRQLQSSTQLDDRVELTCSADVDLIAEFSVFCTHHFANNCGARLLGG